MSLKDSMIAKLKNESVLIHSGDLERFSMECGYKAETGGRVLRKLEEDGIISKTYDKKGCVWYKYGKKDEVKPDIFKDMGITDKPTFGSKSDIFKLKYRKF